MSHDFSKWSDFGKVIDIVFLPCFDKFDTSCDASRALLEVGGRKLLSNLAKEVSWFKQHIEKHFGMNGLFLSCSDPSKCVFRSYKLGITGVDLERELSFCVEMADVDLIVFICTVANVHEDFVKLGDALILAVEKLKKAIAKCQLPNSDWGLPIVKMSLRNAMFADYEMVPFEKSYGRISADLIAVYPPGVHCIAPGEEITLDLVQKLRSLKKAGVRIAYATDESLEEFRVVKN